MSSTLKRAFELLMECYTVFNFNKKNNNRLSRGNISFCEFLVYRAVNKDHIPNHATRQIWLFSFVIWRVSFYFVLFNMNHIFRKSPEKSIEVFRFDFFDETYANQYLNHRGFVRFILCDRLGDCNMFFFSPVSRPPSSWHASWIGVMLWLPPLTLSRFLEYSMTLLILFSLPNRL